MTMYYTELDGAEPTVSIQVKDIKYTFTQESLSLMIEKKISLEEELSVSRRTNISRRQDVKEFFESRYNTGDREICASVEDVNELLVQIGSEELNKTWSATVLITATVTGIEASSKDAARDLIQDGIEVNWTDGDSDIWVDDIDVQSVNADA